MDPPEASQQTFHDGLPCLNNAVMEQLFNFDRSREKER
jgi:hypothetical protein